MREIELTQGKVALIDDEDFERINAHKWYAVRDSKGCRAARNVSDGGKQRRQWMHRVLMAAQPGQEVDHINHDGLCNTRSNLRLCSKSENCCNRRLSSNSRSGFKGVSWNKYHKKWSAYISLGGKHRYLGYFSTKIQAAQAYNNAAVSLHGTFAFLN